MSSRSEGNACVISLVMATRALTSRFIMRVTASGGGGAGRGSGAGAMRVPKRTCTPSASTVATTAWRRHAMRVASGADQYVASVGGGAAAAGAEPGAVSRVSTSSMDSPDDALHISRAMRTIEHCVTASSVAGHDGACTSASASRNSSRSVSGLIGHRRIQWWPLRATMLIRVVDGASSGRCTLSAMTGPAVANA